MEDKGQIAQEGEVPACENDLLTSIDVFRVNLLFAWSYRGVARLDHLDDFGAIYQPVEALGKHIPFRVTSLHQLVPPPE